MKGVAAHVAMAIVATALVVTPVVAQSPRSVLTDSVIAVAVDLYNRPATIRIAGNSDVTAGSELVGDVAVVNGVFEVAGRVRGSVLVINGRLELRAGASIERDVLVIGGTITGEPVAAIGGTTASYRETFSFHLQDDHLVRIMQRPREFIAGRSFDFGRTDIVIASRRGYNRVEGLPINIGPRLTLGHSNPTILEGLLTFRTSDVGFDADDIGYSLRADQYVGGLQAARIGVRAYSEIVPIENAGISDYENSLAAFVFHHDYRDHYEREGWSTYLIVAPPGRQASASIAYTEEWNRPVAPRDPFSIFDNHARWRPEPLAATGRLRAVSAGFSYDTRNVPDDPSDGWWVRLEGERGLGGTLHYTDPVDLPAPGTFTAGVLDLRRYARLGPGSRLGLRLFAAGSLNGDALPVQRQRALGGEGSLPGFVRNQFDCGAENTRDDADFKPFYGCDRAVLVQIEHQGEFGFLRHADIPWIRDIGLLESVRWVAFFDAGRAWTDPDARGIRSTGQDDFAADAGFGLRLGRLGLYWAFPLSGSSGNNVNFFLRLGPRL